MQHLLGEENPIFRLAHHFYTQLALAGNLSVKPVAAQAYTELITEVLARPYEPNVVAAESLERHREDIPEIVEILNLSP